MADNVLMSEMTWTEVDQAMKDRPVALVPVGATEAHGPHLPVSTDSVIATEMARRGALTVAEFGDAFPGTISLPAETAQALVRDLCVTLAKKFRAVALVNIHLEPQHMETLKKAVEEAKKAGTSVCFADVTKKRWVETLGEAFLAGDHAGAFETSLMMAAAPQMVREKTRISLPPIDGLTPALKKGAKTFTEAGGEDAYFGDPTAASAEEGETLFEALSAILTLSVMEHLGSKA